jgi:hypothetical protein
MIMEPVSRGSRMGKKGIVTEGDFSFIKEKSISYVLWGSDGMEWVLPSPNPLKSLCTRLR